jgi:hypothetical protein
MNDELKKLKEEVKRLNQRLDDMSNSFNSESADTTYHIKEIHKRLGHIGDFLWPLVHKIFPGYAQDATKIAALSEGNGSGSKGPPDK